MPHLGFRRPVPHDVRSQFVIASHHPDRLRRPAAAIATADELFRQALTWNVFRTLELIAPSFWLRRFHLRLTGEPALVAPQIVKVRLWRGLSLPAIRRIDGGRPDVVVDVVIETEHDVWTLLAPPEGALSHISERAADVLDAGGWLAGKRPHHCGVIDPDGSEVDVGPILSARYGRTRESAPLRSAARGPAAPAAATWGDLRWSQLAALLAECAGACNLSPVERALASNALRWLQSMEVTPAP
jgi:hypothetical protein